MQRDGEGDDAPDPFLALGGKVQKAAVGAVDVGFAGEGDVFENLAPVSGKFREDFEHVVFWKPAAVVAEDLRAKFVDINPIALRVENFEDDAIAYGHLDSRIKKVTSVDDDRFAAALGLKAAERIDHVVDGAVALEQVHVLDAAETTLERGGEDDDGDFGAQCAKAGGDFCAEFAGAEMVVEDSYINFVKMFFSLGDSGAGDSFVAVHAQDGGAQDEIFGMVVKQQDTDRRWPGRLRHVLSEDAVYFRMQRVVGIAHGLIRCSFEFDYYPAARNSMLLRFVTGFLRGWLVVRWVGFRAT